MTGTASRRSGFRHALAALALVPVALAGRQTGTASAPLFSSYDVINVRLTAPFNDLIEKGRVSDEPYEVVGTLGYGLPGAQSTIEGVKLTLRGHTSIAETECSFPKLKIQFPHGARTDGSPFAGMTSLKIGTHCGDSTDDTVTAKYGRLPNELAPHREALVYRLLDALDVPTLKARPARITYVFTDARGGQNGGKPLVRNAMLLENNESAVRRYGGDREVTENDFTNAHEQFTTADTAAAAFVEAMIGNFDWCLKVTPGDKYRCNARHPLWNIIAAAGAGRARPIVYDFDVSGAVAGSHRWFADVYNDAFVESRSHAAVEVVGQLQHTRAVFGRADLDAARARFNAKKAAAYAALDAGTVDVRGRENIRHYLDAFFEAIASDDAFYRPAVIRATPAYASAAGGAQVCSAQGPVPVGTVVTEPRQTSGKMIEVVLLDTLWHWAPPVKCPAVHTGTVWIDSSAVSRDYPRAVGTQ